MHHLLYCEVPKAGSSSWRRWILELRLLSPNASTGRNPTVNLLSEEDAIRVLLALDVVKFVFVRNPFSRALSAYLQKHVGVDLDDRVRRAWVCPRPGPPQQHACPAPGVFQMALPLSSSVAANHDAPLLAVFSWLQSMFHLTEEEFAREWENGTKIMSFTTFMKNVVGALRSQGVYTEQHIARQVWYSLSKTHLP